MARYRKDEKRDFTFVKVNYGRFLVQYRSLATGAAHTRVTDDMPMVDSVMNEETPKRKDINHLKRFVKRKI